MKLLLFSGGVESTCLALLCKPDLLLTVDYGQKCAEGEIRTSSFLARKLKLSHDVIHADIQALGIGDLAGASAAPEREATEFWPFRNQFLITLAGMYCFKNGFQEIIIGTVSSDSVHEDGRPEFIEEMNKLINAQAPRLTLNAPALNMSTLELVEESGISKELLGWTFSCHTSNVACGHCRGCSKTLKLKEQLE